MLWVVQRCRTLPIAECDRPKGRSAGGHTSGGTRFHIPTALPFRVLPLIALLNVRAAPLEYATTERLVREERRQAHAAWQTNQVQQSELDVPSATIFAHSFDFSWLLKNS
jgi:hypothetical protein